MSTCNVGFLGVGTMGRPMADHLSKNGVQLRVYDVSPDALGYFRDKGITTAASLSDLGAWADILILMLPTPAGVRESLLGSNGAIHTLKPGSIVIDMSTTGPSVTKDCGRQLAQRGIEMVDAPVGKGPAAAAKGDLTILMGGKAEICHSVEWLLKHFGKEMHYCGPLGSGQAVKLVNNMVSCVNAAVLAEAFAIADKAGVDLEVLTRLMPGTAADSWQLRQTVMAKALKNDFTPAFKLSLAHKDTRLALDMANDLEATNGCIRAALVWYDRAAAAGYGELDRAALMLLADRRLKKP
jgi:4-hydroxybutyrate dehydrogenase / sulfolactaldehyde 3-reductase